MPLYSDSSNYYYSGGSSQLYSPYYSSSSGIYTPYSSTSSTGVSPYGRSYVSSSGSTGSYIVPLTPPRSPNYHSSTAHGLSSRYQPKLTTITETSSPLMGARHSSMLPLTRIQSPKYTSYASLGSSGSSTSSSASTPARYIPPRPIAINTADIDVSSSRYRKNASAEREAIKKSTTPEPLEVEKPTITETTTDDGTEESTSAKEQRAHRSTIRRNRAVVRLSTIRTRSKERSSSAKRKANKEQTMETTNFHDLPPAPEPSLSWRQKLAEDLAAFPMPVKKSPGDLLRERFLIQEAENDAVARQTGQERKWRHSEAVPETATATSSSKSPLSTEGTLSHQTTNIEQESPVPPVLSEQEVEETIRRLSLVQCPTFHDICEDISSDKIDDDLNAGELRRRASIIQEQEQEILNQLQKSTSGTFQLIHLERKGSHDSTADESSGPGGSAALRRKSTKKRKSKKIRHKITAIVEVDNAPPTHMPIVQELNEEIALTPTITPTSKRHQNAEEAKLIKPKFTVNVESVEEHHQVHKIFKLPKKKSVKKVSKPKEVELPEGFVRATPKANVAKQKTETKSTKPKSFVTTAEIFTFDQTAIEKQDTTTKDEKHTSLIQPTPSPATPIKDVTTPTNETKTKLFQTSLSVAIDGSVNKANDLKKQTLMTTKSVDVDEIDSKSTVKSTTPAKPTKPETPATLDCSSGIKTSEPTLSPASTITESTEKVATPKPIRKGIIQKSESGEDFWSQIGTRETLYMNKRKKSLHETWQIPTKHEDDKVNNEELKEKEKANEKDEVQEKLKIVEKIDDSKQLEKEHNKFKMEMKQEMQQAEEGTNENDRVKMECSEFKIENVKAMPTIATTTTTTATTMKITSNNNNKVTTTAKISTSEIMATATTTTSVAEQSTTPKINSSIGQLAKSPEQQKQQHQEKEKENATPTAASPTTTTLVLNKTSTLTTPATTTSAGTGLGKPEGATTFVGKKVETTGKGTTATTTTNTTTTATKLANVASTKQQAEPKTAADSNKILSEALNKKKPLATATTATTTPEPKTNSTGKNTTAAATTTTITTTTTTMLGTVAKKKTSPKSPTATTTTTAAAATTSSLASTVVVTPINADQFITMAPAKSATSPTKHKHASPTSTSTATATAAKAATTAAATKTTNKTSAAIKAKKLTPTTIKTQETTATKSIAITTTATTAATTTEPSTTIATAVAATPTIMKKTIKESHTINEESSRTNDESVKEKMAIKNTTKISNVDDDDKSNINRNDSSNNNNNNEKNEKNKNVDKVAATEGGSDAGGDGVGNNGNDSGAANNNNLSKFATVSNLAQCLRDVDAELEDYVPSSAENSEDDDGDYSDDSQYAYSSPDGCSYSKLSASMKKKKQRERRKKDKKAAKDGAAAPRFDPQKKIKIDTTNKCYVKEEAPRYPLVATPRPLWKREKVVYSDEDTEDESSDGTTSDDDETSATTTTTNSNGSSNSNSNSTDDSECDACLTSDEDEGAAAGGGHNHHHHHHHNKKHNAATKGITTTSTAGESIATPSSSSTTATSGAPSSTSSTTAGTATISPSIIRMSTCSNDSGFEGGTAPSSPKKMLECDVNCHKKCERLTANLCGVNQKLIVEALNSVKRGARETRDSPSTPPSSNPAYKIETNEENETSYTYSQFQKSGRFTAPATVIPRFKNYSVDDFHFLAVLGKGSFGKVLLAELRDTTYYYAIKCLKKDVVLEDDDVDSTLIERKVLALGTKHPYLCHLFCTFQTESHLFFVMEYLNGGDLMFHIQESGRFPEERARFYGAEIISGLKFLHKKGIIYRDLKLDNVLLDYEGHVRIADFGMCKLQIYLDKTADSFCGTPDYMAPEIIKGEKYNQNVDWWSFGVLLYEMLIGQSPFSGCDEDELFWSICNEIPWFPVYISAEATGILKGLLEKDYTKRIGSQYSPAGDISDHIFFRPIDWNLLEKRQIEPPFKPQVKHPLDTQYFDRVFTRERVRLTPIDKEILASMDQKQFHGFTYTNPHITLD